MRSRIRSMTWRTLPGLAMAATVVLGTAPAAVAESAPQSLGGIFRITAASCAGGAVSGSTFRMVLPSGTSAGPFVSNSDSSCADHTYTALAPGADGGLVTGTYQAEPQPPFDGAGNSQAARITKPVR